MIFSYTKSQIYRDGYQKALWDVKDWFERHSWALKTLRMYNKKSVEMLLNAICKGADTFMEYGADTAMLFDVDKDNKKKVTKIYVGKGCENDANEVTKRRKVLPRLLEKERPTVKFEEIKDGMKEKINGLCLFAGLDRKTGRAESTGILATF